MIIVLKVRKKNSLNQKLRKNVLKNISDRKKEGIGGGVGKSSMTLNQE